MKIIYMYYMMLIIHELGYFNLFKDFLFFVSNCSLQLMYDRMFCFQLKPLTRILFGLFGSRSVFLGIVMSSPPADERAPPESGTVGESNLLLVQQTMGNILLNPHDII